MFGKVVGEGEIIKPDGADADEDDNGAPPDGNKGGAPEPGKPLITAPLLDGGLLY